MQSGAPCHREDCGGRLHIYCSRWNGVRRVRYLRCRKCKARPEQSKWIVDSNYFGRCSNLAIGNGVDDGKIKADGYSPAGPNDMHPNQIGDGALGLRQVIEHLHSLGLQASPTQLHYALTMNYVRTPRRDCYGRFVYDHATVEALVNYVRQSNNKRAGRPIDSVT